MSDERLAEGAQSDAPEDAESRFQSVGEQLKAAREAQKLSLNDVATRTRVPMRHLDAIEKSDFGALPGITYTVGFAKSYAKSMGLDEIKLAADLRDELAQGGFHGAVARMPAYEPADPARVPPRWLAWSAAALGIVLLAAYLIWRNMALDPSVPPRTATKVVAEAEIDKGTARGLANSGGTTPIDPQGEVVISATETVWVKIYDRDNKRLFEKEMQAGERYTVPADANGPMIVTGRPQVLNVTVGGKPVPPLGSGERSIADVGVSAAALLARPAEPATAPPGAVPVQTGAGAQTPGR